MRARKMLTALTVSIAAVILLTSAGFAHPASSLDLEYSAEDGLLTIWIAHPVGNASSHFISEVKVTVAGRDAADLKYISQGEKGGQRILVTIGSFAPGTEISVKTECSRSGSLEARLKI